MGIAVKFNATISVDVCLVHNNKFVGSVSNWQSRSSTTEYYQSTTDEYAQIRYYLRIAVKSGINNYHSCCIENVNFNATRVVFILNFTAIQCMLLQIQFIEFHLIHFSTRTDWPS